ncbi:chromosome partitioning protein ParA [Brucella endophytica]|uniref:Chromosome partitioning protein ParA n=2 Tax=Brucella endophytica TaxID=1963359 RepID=A0A916SNN6_9HYPH|nr:chromosome partitioning protein ParA [Brucella endophytica]
MTKTISAISTKGGSGKSTTIRILASQLAHEGNTVVILDTDPQGSCAEWIANAEQRGNKIPNVGFKEIEQLSHISPVIQHLRGKVDYILFDVQGAKTEMILPVAEASELIILPYATTDDDWVNLLKTFKILDRIRKSEPIDPKIVLSPNRITAPDVHNPYVKQRSEIAKQMNVLAAERLIWKRGFYSEMLKRYGSIPSLKEVSDSSKKGREMNDSIKNCKKEIKEFTDEMTGLIAGHTTKVA